ncbi:MAG: AraC family transcriptional regulator [Caldisericia bacterium]|nr:AraC family transcriptional regulator [Caldisericia bacterium]
MSIGSYIQAIQQSIDFAEEHIKEKISLEDVALRSGFSLYHFHRVFVALVGTTFSDYLRRRRLSEAGGELLTSDRRIIDIALAYQFESQESFTRSFSKMFGMTPGAFRKAEMPKLFYFKRRLTREILAHLQRGVTMEPKIVVLDEFTVVGMKYIGDNKNQEIPQLWGECNKQCSEDGNCGRHANAKPGSPCLGVCSMIPGEKERFEYIVGVMVDKMEEPGEGYVLKTVPAQKYAVFTHKGSLETLKDTFSYAYSTWLPNSGYELGDGPDLEWYDERFKDFAPDSEFDIMIPIK